MWKWWEQDKSGWSNFYLFLENIAKTAKKQLTSESIMSALTGERERSKCSLCHKSHSGNCNKPKNSAALKQGENLCPVCEEGAHMYQTKAGKEGILKQVKDCPSFKVANDDEKETLIKKVKTKHPVCAKCLSWYHKSQDCTWKSSCTKCGEVHINDLCLLKKFFTCPLSTKGSCMMSLQDVQV